MKCGSGTSGSGGARRAITCLVAVSCLVLACACLMRQNYPATRDSAGCPATWHAGRDIKARGHEDRGSARGQGWNDDGGGCGGAERRRCGIWRLQWQKKADSAGYGHDEQIASGAVIPCGCHDPSTGRTVRRRPPSAFRSHTPTLLHRLTRPCLTHRCLTHHSAAA